ncbi:MAG TPA: amidohydrolase [Caulobacteraceae bacterium]|nr:amidohydrolase [Caulobacteraceae bacterium]
MNRRHFGLAAALAALALTSGAGAAEPKATLLISGGPIYTGDESSPTVEAVAVRGDRIVYAGSRAGAEKLAGGQTTRIDLKGAALFPGFTDAHAHLRGIGERELTLNLEGSASLEEMLGKLKAWADAHPNDPVLVGRGWIETHWPEKRFPVAADLDRVVPDRPVMLGRADGHAVVVNSAALTAAGITSTTAAPEGGDILKTRAGEPNGMLIDAAEQLVAKLMPADSEAQRERAYDAGFKVYAEYGWTGLHNMSVGWDDMLTLEARAKRGDAPLKVYNGLTPEAGVPLLEGGARTAGEGRVITRMIKFYADGALGSRGAALFSPYADRPDTTGLMQTDAARQVPIYTQALRSGIQITTHAIGDRGNAETLDWYDAALKAVPAGERPVEEPRFRVEHAQVLRLSDIPRFRALGVIPSMQPSHAIGDLFFAPSRLGDARLDGAYAWRRIVESGAILPGGSDAPVERGDPLIEFYAAVARKSLDGRSGPDWRADQAVDRKTALKMFTTWPAYASFREGELGLIKPGYRADFSGFSVDLMKAAEAEIPKGRAVLTVVDGVVVYSNLQP